MADEEKDYQEDYYQLLKDESYKSLLSKEVQYDNARKRALKQTNASLGAMGMQSSGYGQTATSGIEGQYLQALEGANETYQNEANNLNIQQMEHQAQQRDQDFARISTMMTEADVQSVEDLNKLMENYGLYSEKGGFNYDKAVELYGEKNAMDLRYLYEHQISGYSRNEEEANAQEFIYDNKGQIGWYDENGNYTISKFEGGGEWGWNKENKALESALKTGTIENNSYVVLKNKKGMLIYLYISNGKAYRTTPDKFNGATGTKYEINYSNIKKL